VSSAISSRNIWPARKTGITGYALGINHGIAVARKTFRQTLQDNDASQRGWAAMFGKPVPAQALNNVAEKRKIVNHTDAEELEGAVMKETRSVLQDHPQIIVAIRQNTGAAWLPGKNFKDVPVWFYRVEKSPVEMTLVDWWGIATWGLFCIECKRRDWKYTGKDAREVKQHNFILLCKKYGYRAGFATSGQQVHDILEGK